MIVPVDLPDDLLLQVQAAAREQGVPFRDFVAHALRGAASAPRPASSKPFVQRAHDFGVHLESPWTVLAEIETDDYTRRFRK
jgi:hypothetical protein